MIARRVSALLLSLCLLDTALANNEGRNFQEWRFNVFLDDSKIGVHSFRIIASGDEVEVQIDADMSVKVLFFTAYEYQHSTRERWGANCLTNIASRTRVNGKRFLVDGKLKDDGLLIHRETARTTERESLPDCVMTFAYWNPDFLQQNRLLNSQTGELVEVVVESLPAEVIDVRGSSVTADHYRVSAETLQIHLWYTAEGKWVALESELRGGRRLRYELI